MTGTDGAFDLDGISRTAEPIRYLVTAEAIRAYAEATDDTVTSSAPAVFAVVPVWEAIAPASRLVASDEVRERVVHYEQDIVMHRPIEPETTLVSHATPVALLPRPNGTSLVIRTETRTDAGELVNEQYVTEFFRDVAMTEGRGERAPDHRLEVDSEPVAELTYPLADDVTVRYAAASGDDFAIHLDDDFARSVGLPGRIVHGLCAMAFTGRAVLETAGSAELKRLAVRFSAPLFPGEKLTTRIWTLGEGVYGFEATAGDRTVIKDGRAELR